MGASPDSFKQRPQDQMTVSIFPFFTDDIENKLHHPSGPQFTCLWNGDSSNSTAEQRPPWETSELRLRGAWLDAECIKHIQ